MKIIWLINIPLPRIAEDIHTVPPNSGGWLIHFSEELSLREDVDLLILFPFDGKDSIQGRIDSLSYYGFPRRFSDLTKYDELLEDEFYHIINDYEPNVIHIWGTEHVHSLAMVKAADKANLGENVVISIQGLVSVLAKHYLSGVPYKAQKRKTLRDIIKKEQNLLKQREKFIKRGKYEVEALQNVRHIIGRTTWDRACVNQINPNAYYHFCNEVLRDSFYKKCWQLNLCDKYSIFMSQAAYPIKGLHFMLEALPLIIHRFPQTHLYIAGQNIINTSTLINKMRLSSYGKFIISLIQKYQLSDHVSFVGNLNETQMVERYLKAHVFVSPSTIENSSNSLGEAMLLGVPIVSSNVGGLNDLLIHNYDGYFYQHDAPYMLAYYVCKIFDDDKLANGFSRNAKNHALLTHNKAGNLNKLISIYDDIVDK